MSQESLGLIETIGLAAAVAAADAAVKSANVTLVGYELAKGDGMTVVKLRGDVGAVQAAVAAAAAAAGQVGRVVATRVIARPARDLTRIVDSRETVGLARPVPVAAPVEAPPAAAPEDAPAPEVVAAPSGAGEVGLPDVPAPDGAVPPPAEAAPTPAAASADAAETVNKPAAASAATQETVSEPAPRPPRAPSRPDKAPRRR